MRKIIQAFLFSVLTGGVVSAVWAAGISFGQLVDQLDERKNTSLAAKENWKKVKGQEVSWSGTVHDVDSGKSSATIYVADKSRGLYKGYNIKVETNDIAKAATLKRGQNVHFKGILDDYRSKDIGAVIYVKNAQVQ